MTVGEDPVVNALAEMEVLFQREADGSLLNLTEAGPLLLLDDGFGGEIILLSISVSYPWHFCADPPRIRASD